MPCHLPFFLLTWTLKQLRRCWIQIHDRNVQLILPCQRIFFLVSYKVTFPAESAFEAFSLFYFILFRFFYLILFRVVVVSTAQFSTLWSLAFWPTLADTFFRSIKRKKKNAEKRRKMHKHSEIQFFTSLEKWKLLIIEKHNEPCNSITIIILFVIY